jgi:hypothetical protein
MLRSLTVGSSLLAAACLVGVAYGEDLRSGLQKGDSAGPFQVRNITGQKCEGTAKDDRGSLCYR